jgi:glycerophosphoryl diester phosphodiesterase
MHWFPTGRLRIGGHRGAAGVAPENTMVGFLTAVAAGADYLELDIRISADDSAIVLHDDDLARTTNGSGRPEHATLADLAALDAGSWFDPKFGGERIPTLADVLALLDAHPPLGATLEAKGHGSGRVIAARVGRSSARPRLSTCAFDPEELVAIAETSPTMPRLLILDRETPDADPLAAARGSRATGVNLPLDWLDESRVRELHRARLLVAGGTVDDEQGIARAIALGVDVVDSNDPAAAVRWRDAIAPRNQ